MRLLALHAALGLWTLFGSLTLKVAHRLRADMAARLIVLFFALHLTSWLVTLCLTSCAILGWAEVLRAHYFAFWLPALHLATLGVEALTAGRAKRLIAFGLANPIARFCLAIPCALRCTVGFDFRRTLLLLLSTPFLRASAVEVLAFA